MFEGVKRRWAEARANVLSKQVEYTLLVYQRMNRGERGLVFGAFDHALSELEDQTGPLGQWTNELKKEVAKQMMMEAMQEYNMSRGAGVMAQVGRVGAHGGVLLSVYLELQTLPGNQAIELVRAIDGWRKTACSEEC